MAEPANETQGRRLSAAAFQGAVATAAVAGAFSLVVSALLAWNAALTLDPRDSAELATLKRALGQKPEDEALKARIRDVDLGLRLDYFARRDFAGRGTWLLVAGVAVFLIAARSAAALRQALPMPQGARGGRGAEARAAARGRRAVVCVAGVVACAFAALAWQSLHTLPSGTVAAKPGTETPVSIGTPESIGTPAPTADEMAREWPRFRGPGGLGISAYANLPTKWDGKTGEGVQWKTPVPLDAPNSPVVWGDRVFLTGATKSRREVYCFSVKDGALLWTGKVANVPGSPAKPPEVMDATGYAASTAATDGRRVYAIFANGDLAAFDFAGKRVWAKSLGKFDNSYGHASSLLTWRDRLIVLVDQGLDDDDLSKLYAFDGASGRQVWASVRQVGSTWATPIVVEAGGREQIITVSVPWVAAYAPETGEELWLADIMDGEVAPSPVFANGHVIVAQAHSIAAALRADGTGDVTKTHVAWEAEDGLPDTCSPLASGELLFLSTADGLLTCYDVKDGSKAWEHEFELMQFLSSPTLVGDKVYLLNDKGVMFLYAAARAFKVLGRCELGERTVASPACLDGRIILRSHKHLFCIGKP